jgi:hypothetical protein
VSVIDSQTHEIRVSHYIDMRKADWENLHDIAAKLAAKRYPQQLRHKVNIR